MKVQRCPECGGRLKSNYCDICMRRVPFGGVTLKKYREPWDMRDTSSAHSMEKGHECVTFGEERKVTWAGSSAHRTEKDHRCVTFGDPKASGRPVRTANTTSQTSKKKSPTVAKLVAIFVAVTSLLPAACGIMTEVLENVFSPDPVPEPGYIQEAVVDAPALPYLEPTTLYSDGGITVTADSLDWYYEIPALSLTVSNESDRDIIVMMEKTVVNDYSIHSGFYAEVEEDAVVQDYLSFDSQELEQANIETIARIDLRLRIYDSKTYEDIAYIDRVTLQTDAISDYAQTFDRSGTELYSDGSVSVIYRNTALSDYGDGEVELLLENLSGSDAMVTITDIQLNGQTVSGYLGNTLLPETYAIDSIYFYDLEELELQDVEQIHEITVSMQLDYMEGWNILQTVNETITFTP